MHKGGRGLARGSWTDPGDDLLARAIALAPIIGEDALEAERLGRLTDRVAQAILAANLCSILVPVADGGLGGNRLDLFRVVEAIAKADGSAGWCVSACNTVNYTACMGLGPEGRRAVFGQGPVSGWTAFAPRTLSTPVDGGFRISGDWSFGSGSSFSNWVLVTTLLRREGEESLFRAHMVPRSDVAITEGSWDVMGLRATASIDWTITDKFVPAHLAFEFPSGASAPPEGVSIRDGGRLNQAGLTAFACGSALAALEDLVAEASQTKRMTADHSLAEDHLIQFEVGDLEGRLRAARGHFMALISRQDERLAEGGMIDPEMGFEFTQGAHTLSRIAREVVLFAFDQAPTNVVYARHPAQRRLRDVLTGLKHASFSPALIGRIGKVRMGGTFGRRGF
jgi:alkylation response protein AidB-like acyl-CoA dehydrogenase